MSDEATADGAAPTANAGYDEWIDALADGTGYALVCPEGHGSLPPRRVCPECGSSSLAEEPLPDRGEIETFTVVHVPSPRFADDAPYTTAVARFGPVRLTGIVRGVDGVDDGDEGAGGDAVAVGTTVEVGVGERETDGGRIVTFRPVGT
ncbi:nucleic acid-binding protein [Halorubrum sp. 48-1-W]|uniref:Zn-ribbon domain-containing OB-fold protein n=1 Tax=Halorubrum sp. 48-1-W TaxID=2249761 RepID=UPI000DCD56FA|nr:OB-fold domain-containing protein [Halorubrum sp. 48-1-W]RAW46489.1 nucleic acid-binding protein [Halorubrum sp. 48-1-W]